MLIRCHRMGRIAKIKSTTRTEQTNKQTKTNKRRTGRVESDENKQTKKHIVYLLMLPLSPLPLYLFRIYFIFAGTLSQVDLFLSLFQSTRISLDDTNRTTATAIIEITITIIDTIRTNMWACMCVAIEGARLVGLAALWLSIAAALLRRHARGDSTAPILIWLCMLACTTAVPVRVSLSHDDRSSGWVRWDGRLQSSRAESSGVQRDSLWRQTTASQHADQTRNNTTKIQ